MLPREQTGIWLYIDPLHQAAVYLTGLASQPVNAGHLQGSDMVIHTHL